MFVPIEGRDRQSCCQPRGSLHLDGNAELVHGTLVCMSLLSLMLSAAELRSPLRSSLCKETKSEK